MEAPEDKRWIAAVIDPLRAHGYTGSAYNRVWEAISRDQDEKGRAGAYQRAHRVVTALLHIVTNGLLPGDDHERQQLRLRRIQATQAKLARVHRFLVESSGDHKLPRVHRKRAGSLIPILEELGRENEERPS